MSTDSIYKTVIETHNRSKNINFVLSKSGKIMMSSQKTGIFAADLEKDLRESSEKDLSAVARKMALGESGIETIKADGEEYLLSYAPIATTKWSFGILLPKKEVNKPAENVQKQILLQMDGLKTDISKIFWITIPLSAVLFMIIIIGFKYGTKMSNKFVKPIEELSAGVQEIASGNFDKKLDIKTGDEIENLAISFNDMTLELKNYIENLKQVTAEQEKASAELEIAKNIQQSMLPREFEFPRSEFEIYAIMEAAKEVGGDFYDFYLVDERHLIFTVADVSGKGIPAALFMVISKTMLKNFAQMMIGSGDLGALVTFTNQKLCESNDEMMFLTMFIGILDLKSGEMIYVNAGHNASLI